MPKGIPREPKKITRDRRGQCGVCQHPERVRVEALRSGGVTLDALAKQFGLHRDAIWRHMRSHVSPEAVVAYLAGPAKVQQLVQVAAEESGSVLDYLRIVRSTLVAQLDRLARANDAPGVATISGKLLDTLQAIGRISGEIGDLAAKTTVNIQLNQTILSSQPFTELQAGLLRVCAAHPAARRDVVALLRQLDEKYSGAPRMIESQPLGEVVNG